MSCTNGAKLWRYTKLVVWWAMVLQVCCVQKLYTYKEYVTNEVQKLYHYKENVGRTIAEDMQNVYQLTEWIKVIYPGTKWCGDGSVASNYDDLGIKRETDACCRQHDFCDDIIEAGASKHGLTNDASYTKLHCDCDDIFYKCLMHVSETTQENTLVGFMYFNFVGTQCYKEEYPITGCRRHSVGRRCLEYNLDHSAPKTWQWFDAPFF